MPHGTSSLTLYPKLLEQRTHIMMTLNLVTSCFPLSPPKSSKLIMVTEKTGLILSSVLHDYMVPLILNKLCTKVLNYGKPTQLLEFQSLTQAEVNLLTSSLTDVHPVLKILVTLFHSTKQLVLKLFLLRLDKLLMVLVPQVLSINVSLMKVIKSLDSQLMMLRQSLEPFSHKLILVTYTNCLKLLLMMVHIAELTQ